MTVRINKQKINLREKLAETEEKVSFDEVVRGLGEYSSNVGIGATDPAALLHIKSTSTGDTGIIIENTNNAQNLDIDFYSNSGTGPPAFVGVAQGRIRYQEGLGNFEINPNVANDAPFKILYNGNVGIGTADPDYPLDVSGWISASADAPSTDAVINLVASNATKLVSPDFNPPTSIARIKCISESDTNSSSALAFYTRDLNNNIDERVRINSLGNVGIGTTVPGSYKLNVNGTARVSGGDVTSDDRVKHNEQNIVGALETLSKVTPKKYIKTTEMYDANHDFQLDADGNPIDENGEPVEHRIEAGVIAQQVLSVDELAFAVSPEGVDEDGNVTSPHGLDYNSLFTYAIAAIQEQQQTIEDLKSRIETLEQQ